MNTLIPHLLDVSLCLVALFIAVRSFDIYARFHQYRLFILGLSMVLVSISAAADFISSYVTVITLQTDWFLYIGQSVGFLFILLSLLRSSDSYLMSLQQYFVPILNQYIFRDQGDISGVVGLIVLVAAVSIE